MQRYAQMVRGDRALKLAAYEVFRCGAGELQAPTAKADLKAFLEALFKRYGVPNELTTQRDAVLNFDPADLGENGDRGVDILRAMAQQVRVPRWPVRLVVQGKQ
ncbi:hypothetical protein [Paraburkholderia graminis]|uniref:hypothetical protein n=1 Tax=Paraburkholderia graminis TaxID=60548 RepID=UPI0027D8C0EF|nr:hypothetical protein [Paraburkholderia graminis]